MGVLSQKPPVFLILNYELDLIIITAKEASPMLTAIPNSHQHYRSWTSTWFPAAAWTTDIHKASGRRSMEYIPQHGPWWQHGSQTSTWSPVAALPMDNSLVSGRSTYLLVKQFLGLAFKVLLLEMGPIWFIHKSPPFRFHHACLKVSYIFFFFFVGVFTYQTPQWFLDHSTSLMWSIYLTYMQNCCHLETLDW